MLPNFFELMLSLVIIDELFSRENFSFDRSSDSKLWLSTSFSFSTALAGFWILWCSSLLLLLSSSWSTQLIENYFEVIFCMECLIFCEVSSLSNALCLLYSIWFRDFCSSMSWPCLRSAALEYCKMRLRKSTAFRSSCICLPLVLARLAAWSDFLS